MRLNLRSQSGRTKTFKKTGALPATGTPAQAANRLPNTHNLPAEPRQVALASPSLLIGDKLCATRPRANFCEGHVRSPHSKPDRQEPAGKKMRDLGICDWISI